MRFDTLHRILEFSKTVYEIYERRNAMFVVFSIRMRRIRSDGGINEQGKKDSMEQERSVDRVSKTRRERRYY